jgi:hypothetical protein
MTIAYRNYVASESVGDLPSSLRLMEDVWQATRAWKSAGWCSTTAVVIESQADAEDELFDCRKAHELTGGFPYLWVHLAFDPDGLRPEEVRRLEERFALRPFSDGIIAGTLRL